MKNFLRNWLGINEDAQAIAADINQLHERTKINTKHIFEMLHTLPYAHGIPKLRAENAAEITEPNGISANSLPAILTGVVLNARQGESSMQVDGALPEDVREVLTRRGFKVEEHEGTAGKFTFILWT